MEPSNQEQSQVGDARNLESIDYRDTSLWKKLIQSNDTKDKQLLNAIAMKIIETKDNNLFASLVAHDYKIDVLNEKGQTALHYAFYIGGSQIVATIVNWEPFKKTSSDHTDSNGLAHLHIACTKYHANVLEMIKRYLKDGSDINACYHSDPENKYSKFTPLHFAVKYEKFDIVKFFLENGANINAVDAKCRTPFHLAFQLHSIGDALESIELSIKSFNADLEARDEHGNTPLLGMFDDYEEIDLYFEIVKAKKKFDVLLKNGADIGAKNNKGDTVLHLIIKTLRFSHCHFIMPYMSFDDTVHAELVKEILKSNGELLEVKNNEEKTPLQLAISMTSADVVKVLLDHNADISFIKIDCGDENIFCYPAMVPNFDIVHNIMSIIRLIVDRGFELSLKDYLTISKFLVHDVTSCHCSWDDYDDNVIVKIMNVLEYGSATHTKQVFSELIENSTIYSNDHLNCLRLYLNIMKKSNFYLDEGVEEILTALLYPNNNDALNKKAEKELAYLKSDVKLTNGVMLYDLMLKHPHAASRFFTDDSFDCKLLNDFVQYKSIIEGFITKVTVRNYILKMAHIFLPMTSLSLLPDLCNELLYLSFLSNVDIFKFCSAMSVLESGEPAKNLKFTVKLII